MSEALAQPERRLGRYVLLDQLGRGGVGVVHRAWDTALRRHVAVKMLANLGPAHAQMLQRFEREGLAAGRLRHPGIVAVHELGRHADRPYIVMDLIDGSSLEARLEREALPPRRVAELVQQVALALEHAHARGIIHRDVKPENILIDREDRPLLTDFGLARDLGGSDDLTLTGQLLGTPAYMAPEQAGHRARDEVGPPTDVYGLGGVLYRALAGRPPFEADDLIALVRQVLADEPAPPRRLRPELHPDLETIVLRCLEKAPHRRYPTARALADDLRRFLDGELIAARPPSRAERVRRWTRRHKIATGALGAAVLAVAGAAVAAGVAFTEARRRVIARAADEAEAARAAFVQAREALPDPSGGADVGAAEVEARRKALDHALARALEAQQAALALHLLAPADATARRGAFDATMACGEVALRAEQWSVAASAFGQARELGVDDAAARAAVERVDAERRRIADERRAVVARVLERARAGELAERRLYEDAFFTLVRLPDRQTVDLLVAALDEVTRAMAEATREVYRAHVAIAGHERCVDPGELDAALDRWLARDPASDTELADRMVMEHVAGHVKANVRQRRGSVTPSGSALVGIDVGHRVGAPALTLARLCCEAIGRIGISSESAVEALGRHLAIEHDALRAAVPAVALARLGGERAERIVMTHFVRFEGGAGAFAQELGPLLPRFAPAPTATATATGETAEAVFERGANLYRRGAHREAIPELTRAIELAEAGRAQAAEPGRRLIAAAALTNRALAREQVGDIEGARADYARAIELAPADAAIFNNRGSLEFALGDYGRALADFDRALEIDPDFVMALCNRGLIRKEQGDHDGAIADLRRAAAIEPSNAEVLANLGGALRAKGELAEALRLLDRAVELDPDGLISLVNRGNVKLAVDDLDGAVADFRRAAEVSPRVPLVWRNLGVACSKRGDLDGAAAAFGRLIELTPDDTLGWRGRADARRDKGDLAGAIADLDEVIKRAPGSATAVADRGELLIETGELDRALADFERLLHPRPDHPRGLYGRGLVRAARGDRAGATADLERFLAVHPEAGPRRDRALAELKRLRGGD